MSEDEKEKYFFGENISYIKSDNNEVNNILLNNNNCDLEQKREKLSNISFDKFINDEKFNINNFSNSLENYFDNINIIREQKYINFPYFFNCNVKTDIYKDSFELYKIFDNSIKHILLAKPYFNNINNNSLKKMEFEYLKKDLSKKGINSNNFLNGCLDCISDILN